MAVRTIVLLFIIVGLASSQREIPDVHRIVSPSSNEQTTQHHQSDVSPAPSIRIIDSHRRLPSFPVCYMCGSIDLIITKPNVVVDAPGISPTTCIDLYRMLGSSMFYNPNLCGMLPQFGIPDKCGCPKTSTPSSSPTVRPLYPKCNICGNNSTFASQPNTALVLPSTISFTKNATTTTCGILEQQGLQGSLTSTYCKSLKSFDVADACGCATIPSTPSNLAKHHYPQCDICSGDVLTLPNVIVPSLGTLYNRTCLQVLYLGLSGRISPSYCYGYSSFDIYGICGCQSRTATLSKSKPPTRRPSQRPSSPPTRIPARRPSQPTSSPLAKPTSKKPKPVPYYSPLAKPPSIMAKPVSSFSFETPPSKTTKPASASFPLPNTTSATNSKAQRSFVVVALFAIVSFVDLNL